MKLALLVAGALAASTLVAGGALAQTGAPAPAAKAPVTSTTHARHHAKKHHRSHKAAPAKAAASTAK